MPFTSQAQRRFLFARKPKIAKEFAEETPKGANLPEKAKKRSNQIAAMKRQLK